MNNQKKIGLIAGVILVMLVFVWLFSSSGEDNNQVRKPFVSSNWTTSFQPYDKNPKGLYLFNVLVDNHLDSTHGMYLAQDWIDFDSLLVEPEPKTFLFVGNNFGLGTGEMDSIINRVKHGSDLFISYNMLTDNIINKIWKKPDELFEYNSEITVFTPSAKYKMINLYQNDTIACDWGAFGEVEPVGDYKTLSSFMELDNFIAIKLGRGVIYAHATPNQFYNYQLRRKPGFEYAEYAINQIPKDQDVVMLEFGRQPDNYGDYDIEDIGDQAGKENDSYWKIILENPSLRSALLLAIATLLLFIIFRSKRTRPIVPYIQKKKDMTLAFAETITSIYFSKRNPYGLLQIQRRNFYDTILKHYYIDLYHREDDRQIEALAEKSNRSVSEIKQIIELLETKEAFSVSDQVLAKVAKIKRDFYLSMGILNEKTQKIIASKRIEIKRSLLIPSVLVLGGISVIIAGFYYLVLGYGIGIALWPIGIALTTSGVIMITKPLLVLEDGIFTYFNPFGFKKTYKLEDFLTVTMKSNGAVIQFTKNRNIIINNRELSSFDKKQFNNLITKLHKDEL